jgi:hypothetical protein
LSYIRKKPEKKIDELNLLITIHKYKHNHMGWGPTAADLYDRKREFAPSLTRIDTLRMWLYRHNNRTIRRTEKRRPERYELTRQGKKRIVFEVKRMLENAVAIKKLSGPGLLPRNVRDVLIILYDVAIVMEETEEGKRQLFDLITQALRF